MVHEPKEANRSLRCLCLAKTSIVTPLQHRPTFSSTSPATSLAPRLPLCDSPLHTSAGTGTVARSNVGIPPEIPILPRRQQCSSCGSRQHVDSKEDREGGA